MAEKMTRKELAARWGVSPQYVGRLVREQGLGEVGGKIDVAEADALRGTFEPSRIEKEVIAKSIGGQATAAQSNTAEIVQARTIEAKHRAELLRVKVAKLNGSVLAVEEVKRQSYEIGRAVNAALTQMPNRCGGEIASLVSGKHPREVERIARSVVERQVKRAIEDVIAALARVVPADQGPSTRRTLFKARPMRKSNAARQMRRSVKFKSATR